MFSYFVRLLVGVAFLAGVFLLAKACVWLQASYFPARHLEERNLVPLDQLREKYKSRDRWLNLMIFLTIIGLSAVYFGLLSWLGGIAREQFAAAKYLLHPFWLEAAILGFFLSVVSTPFYVFVAMSWILGQQEYAVYCAYGERRMRNGSFIRYKVWLWMFLLIFLPLAVVASMRATTFTAFTEAALFDSDLKSFGVPTKHAYSDIEGLYQISGYHARFEDITEPYYLLIFNDGYRWRTDRGSGGPRFDYERKIVQFVAESSGVPIRDVAFVEDILP